MLRRLKELEDYKIKARDGEIGHVHNFYFDDRDWKIRYMVVNTGNWLTGRHVLISPKSIGKPDWENKVFPVEFTKEQIEKSPDISKDKPVSRQHEMEIVKYYGWPEYWIGPGSYISGGGALPAYLPTKTENELQKMEKKEKQENSHLRDANEIKGYNIHAKDGKIGHVQDFIIDDDSLNIFYLIIDTRDFFPGGKKVFVSISWIDNIDWSLREVKVDLSKDQIENSPEWDISKPMTRDFEDQLYEHFKKDKYWTK